MELELRPYHTRRMELSLEQGCLTWGSRVVIPHILQGYVLALLHAEHPGTVRMKMLARGLVWWPGLDADIENVVKNCNICQAMQSSMPRAPLEPWPFPARCWQRVHVDFFEHEGASYLLYVDAYSKWIDVVHMKSTTAFNTIEQIRSLFVAYGLPEQLVSDNGPQFAAREFNDFLESWGVRHTYSPPYHPQSNGAAERCVQTVKRTLRKQLLHDGTSGTHRTLRERLDHFLLAYRTTPCTVTGRSPAELFLKRAPRTKLSLLKPSFQEDMKKRQHKAKSQSDRHRSAFRFFTEGDKVYVKTVRGEKVSWTEGLVVEVISPVAYSVNTGGKVHFVHVDHLRVASFSQPADMPASPPTLARQSPYPANAATLPSVVPPQVPMAGSSATEVREAPVPDRAMQGDHPAMEGGGYLQRNPGEEPIVQTTASTPEGSPRPALLQPTPSEDSSSLRRSSRRRQQPDRYQSEDFRNGT